MSTVMKRPRVRAESRRKQLLELATKLFARQGFGSTTTKQLAQHAGINESIVFRFFRNKEDLYWHVIENIAKTGGDRSWFERALQSGGTDQHVFTAIALGVLRREKDPVRLLLFTQLENHRLSHRFFGAHIEPLYEAMANYIEEGIRAGRFRKVNAALAARFFIGGLAHHFQLQEIFSGKDFRQFNATSVAESFVDIWLRGMQRSEDGSARPRRNA